MQLNRVLGVGSPRVRQPIRPKAVLAVKLETPKPPATGKYGAVVASLGLDEMLAEALGAADLAELATMGEEEVSKKLEAVGLSGLAAHVMKAAQESASA